MVPRRVMNWTQAFLLIAVLGTACSKGKTPPYFQPIWEKRTNFIAPNDPVVIDLNADGANEILVTDSQGRIVVYSGAKGRVLWSARIRGVSLTGPAVGNFWGDGSLDVAVADNRGFVHLLNGGDGRILQEMDLKTSFSIDPTVLPPDPVIKPGGAVDFRPEERDRLLVIGDSNVLYSLVFNPDSKSAGIEWTHTLKGRAMAPASIGDIDGDGRLEVVLGVALARLGVLHVLRGIDGKPIPGSPSEYDSNIETVVTLADVNGDGRDEMFFGTVSRHLHGVRYEPDQQRFWPLWGKQALAEAPKSDPLLLQTASGWKAVTQTRTQIIVHPLGEGKMLRKGAQAPITSGIGLASGSPAAPPRLFFGDELSGVYDWLIEEARAKMSMQYRGEQLELTPVLADFDGQPGAECLLYFSRKRRLRMVAITDGPYPAKPHEIVWQTRAGNLWRTGRRDTRRYYPALQQRYRYLAASIDATLAEAARAYKAKSWKKAIAAADTVLDVNPNHRDALKLRRKAWVHYHLVGLAVTALVGLVLLAAVIYIGTLLVMRRIVLKQAAELTQAGRLDEAIDLYHRVHQRFPNHSATNAALAGLLIGQDRLEPQYASVFEHAYDDRPSAGELLQAMSECFARSGVLTPRARDVYMKSLDVSERPAELKFLIGRSFLAEQRFQDAVRYLGEALAGGFQSEEVYQSLADAYFQLRLDQEEVLPVLEHVAPARFEDNRFMAYLCDVYLANGRSDEKARECAEKALEYDPSCRSARMLYVQILLDHGQAEGAWRRVEAIFRDEPDKPDVLRLVSLCLIALDRRDDEAVQILEKTLAHYPDEPRILAHLSHVYFMRGWFDPHAADVHRRAWQCNPDDDRVVEAMADLAEREGDEETAARHLEKLLELGRKSRELMVRLARLYRNLGIEDERARRPFEVAFEENPDDPDCLKALGKVYLRLGETSQKAVAVLGRLYDDGVALDGLERGLIAALDENGEYEPLREICDKYLASHPDENEVRRIRAHAFLSTGDTEKATEEYERLLDEGPEEDRVVTELGLAYAQAQRTDERAISIYKRALRIAPDQHALHLALGCAHVERGDLREAIEQFRAGLRVHKDSAPAIVDACESLLEDDPDRAPLRWFLCEVLINCGRFREATDHLRSLYERQPEAREQALEALSHILNVDPENSHAHRVRGEILFRLGKIAEAREDLEQSDRLRPNREDTEALLGEVYRALLEEAEDAEVRFRLGRIYENTGDLDAALRCFQKSVHDYRFEAESTREMGKIFMEKNMLDLALEEFQKLEMDDDLKETIYKLGQMYEQRGDGGGARAAYRIIFAADAGFRDVQERFEALSGEAGGERTALDRTMIISQLSEKAKHRYKLLEEIGRGAMGIVYKAMDSELDEIVALKILPDNLSTNTDALARFRREARSARRLSHRNIVRIHDIGEEMGRKYISMEFIEGTTLKALIRTGGGLEIPRALKYACQILDALAYAHSIGIVHRDIKPANIIITRDDEVKITDFGIAKVLESTDATAEGAVVGTPLYMSPEQVRGEPVDHRADIYSVGILLYESIEGRPPFIKGDLAYSHLHVWPDPMTRASNELNKIVMRALEKRKEDRWPSTQAMLDALRSLESAGGSRSS